MAYEQFITKPLGHGKSPDVYQSELQKNITSVQQYELQLFGVHICGRSALLGEEASLCLIQNVFFDHQPAADLSTGNHKDGGEAPALQRNNIQQPPTTCRCCDQFSVECSNENHSSC